MFFKAAQASWRARSHHSSETKTGCNCWIPVETRFEKYKKLYCCFSAWCGNLARYMPSMCLCRIEQKSCKLACRKKNKSGLLSKKRTCGTFHLVAFASCTSFKLSHCILRELVSKYLLCIILASLQTCETCSLFFQGSDELLNFNVMDLTLPELAKPVYRKKSDLEKTLTKCFSIKTSKSGCGVLCNRDANACSGNIFYS